MPTASSNEEISPRSAPQGGRPPRMSKELLLLGCITILTPFSLDMYLPALPGIAAELHAGAGAVQLTLPVFFVGLALSQLTFGSLADHLGRRPPLLCGLAMLTVGSIGCALAPNVVALTFWRLVSALGVGSASVIPRAVVRDRFDVAHVARALSLLGLITGLGPILAPQLGGLLLLIANWRLTFWVLAALSAGSLLSAYRALPESLPAGRPPAIGPRLWLRLLTDRHYLRYALSVNLLQSSVFAYLSGAPFVFIDLLKLSPQQFAWMFGINAVGLMICGRINAHILGRYGPELILRRAMRLTAVLGLVLFAVALTGAGGFWGLAIPQFLFVSTLAFNFSNGFAIALIPFGDAAGTASALFGTLQFMIAGLAGAAVSAAYDGSARAMTGVMAAAALLGLIAYRVLKERPSFTQGDRP